MNPLRVPNRWMLTALTSVALVIVGWLVVSLCAMRRGWVPLPSAAGGVEFLRTDGTDAEAVSHAGGWQRWDGTDFLRSDGPQALWLRVTLENPEAVPRDGVLADQDFYVDRADFWLRDETGGWRVARSGEWRQGEEKALWGREMAFPVNVPARGARTVYLRMQDYFGVCMKPVWWPERSVFHAARMRRTVAEGAYFGMLLALLFYNALLWAGTRLPGIGGYVLYMMTFSVFLLAARGEFALGGMGVGSPWMEVVLMVALALSGWFLMGFARAFLELPARAPRANRMMSLNQRVLLGLAVAAPLVIVVRLAWWLPAIMAGTVLAHLVLLAATLVSWRKGLRDPRHLILLFGLVFAGIMPAAACWLQLVSLEAGGVIVMAGSALEFLTLSLVVSVRYSRLQQEKIAAQQELLEEAAARKVMQEAYADELELEVNERTRELHLALADKDRMIAVLGHDLRGPLTGLTQRAEQLAAGGRNGAHFPEEAAGMGRQLLLLIEDLVLWGNLRAGTVNLVVKPARSVVEPVVALYRAAAEREGKTLVVEVPGELGITTDLVLAQTLLRNLLSNALKFARRRVVVSVAEDGKGARFAVRDDGPGLKGGVIPVNGSGLGLRLCVEIAAALETRLETRAVEGGGTEFHFTLPRVEAEVPA
ncbi:sensor histidine kinase [Luteolibacter ambystomatis]|uniref:histidine kinase n=1 Tax=Luteolibacter ambystomatis TaxID=2824561 RepID=A0A975PGX3_9BACT|nr:sensor histidine kinase [Luteolibacter ambystomatis]QUE53020.1 sensor histidine kinase [Luteolibacter ambystomatis]